MITNYSRQSKKSSHYYNVFGFHSDGRVVRASASGAIDLGLISSRVKPMTLKLVFTAAFLLEAQHLKGQCGEQAGKFTLVVPLEKSLSGISPSWYGRQVAGTS